MDIHWPESNWQHKHFNSRQTVSFTVSALLVLLFLTIPIKYQYSNNQQETLLAIELVKPTPIVEKLKKIEPKVIPRTTMPVKPITKPITEPKPIVKPPKIIAIIPQEEKLQLKPPAKLPSAGTILNSLRNRTTLQTVDKDFQTSKENDDFIYKQTLKPKTPQLFTDRPVIQDMVVIKTPLALKTLRTAIGFLIKPMEDGIKTQDNLNYCPSLGRKSVFCPNGNPFSD